MEHFRRRVGDGGLPSIPPAVVLPLRQVGKPSFEGNQRTVSQFPQMDQKQVEQTLRRQLTAFSQFSSRSLNEANIDALMLDACIKARAGTAVTHAKLLEYLPDRDRLLLRSGVGWKDGYVGQYQVSPDIDTPIGHAFILSEPVAIGDYSVEKSTLSLHP
jgi:hypothetical protein